MDTADEGPRTEEIDRIVQRTWMRVRSSRSHLLSTYRVQFHPAHFRFADAQRLVRYLHFLGVSHLYAAPHLRARPGSTHGYDVVDHNAINTELGTEADLEAVHVELERHGMSMLLDWVPNHMGVGTENEIWQDVLENGPSSRYARFVDIDWHPVKAALANRVLVPVLGDHYGVVLERGEIRVAFGGGTFWIAYYDHRFPVGPRGYAMILGRDLDALTARHGASDQDVLELQSIITAVNNLPLQTETDPAKLAERWREKEVVKRRLADLAERSPAVRAHIDANVETINGRPGVPESFDGLDSLLEMQGYRLASWRVAGEEINYRRFFDINELIAVRMEEPEVFEHTHRLLRSWIARGWVQAVRIDHPDGLFDPREYFLRLRTEAMVGQARRALAELIAEDPNSSLVRLDWKAIEQPLRARCRHEVRHSPRGEATPLDVFVEKILAREERLPESWSVSGTTGYDFLNAVNGLFVDRGADAALDRIYARLVDSGTSFAELVRECKTLILDSSLMAEVQMLAHRLDQISEADRRTRDFTLGTLRDALVEIIACFPVYRTYVSHEPGEADARDREFINTAVDQARQRLPATSSTVFDFIRDVLLKNHPARLGTAAVAERLAFLGKFQQVTPPAMAKGIEDTAFYRFNRLISLNEVGGEPEAPGTTVEEFHALNRERVTARLHSLLATSTHDTKRSEDVRVRIDAISEDVEAWGQAVAAWWDANAPLRRLVAGESAPSPEDEYAIYQTLLGVWPGGSLSDAELDALATRLIRYFQKAAREAKVHSSWISPSEPYEQALASFIADLLGRSAADPFWTTFHEIQRRVAWAGMHSSLAQVVLKIASPGVPDFYQGCELWNLHLVDPDNRQPVDFRRLETALEAMAARLHGGDSMLDVARDLAASPGDGRVKLFVTWRALSLRRKLLELFTSGQYVPMDASGERGDHVIAFARVRPGSGVIVVAGRLWLSLSRQASVTPDYDSLALPREAWADCAVRLPPPLARGTVRDVFTGRTYSISSDDASLPVGEVLSVLPVAMLEWDLV